MQLRLLLLVTFVCLHIDFSLSLKLFRDVCPLIRVKSEKRISEMNQEKPEQDSADPLEIMETDGGTLLGISKVNRNYCFISYEQV